MKKTIFASAALIGIALSILPSCKDAEAAQFNSLGKPHIIFNSLGKPHIITMYGCDGKEIAKWRSTGSVLNEANSDGWYFEDKATGKLIEVTGTLVIEVE